MKTVKQRNLTTTTMGSFSMFDEFGFFFLSIVYIDEEQRIDV
uniref:Uncharacterized protein n=1 Tax=Rhizophora mucronata TaxID=61149 RepID=A0A2P2Q0D9_RHIMU